jgi:hypothetical protein
MVPIININNGIKEPTCGYQNCNTSQIFIFGEYVKVIKIIVYLNYYLVNTISNHSNTGAMLPGMKILA